MSSTSVPTFLNADVSYTTADRPLSEAEFAETWAYIQSKAYATARRFGASDIDAEDIVQEASLVFLRQVRCSAVPAALPAVTKFVHGVVWRLTVGLHRRARTTESDADSVPSQLVDPEAAVQHHLDLQAVDEVVRAKLVSKDLEVILGGLNGEGSDELAERLRSTPGAVRTRRSRAISTLRKELERRLNLDEAA